MGRRPARLLILTDTTLIPSRLTPRAWSAEEIARIAEPTGADELAVRAAVARDTPFLSDLFDAEPIEEEEV